MNVLALETSTLKAAIALRTADGRTIDRHPDPNLRHGRSLIPSLRDLLADAGLRPSELQLVAVGLGPGSFTGLRIGLTAAKTLAFACRCPLIGLDSFDVIARNAAPDAMEVAVVADAQRGEWFAATFAREVAGAPLQRREPTRILSALAFLGSLTPGATILGPALDRESVAVASSIERLPAELNHPRGYPLLDAACEAFAAGRRDDPWFLEPIYIRRSAAEEKREAMDRDSGTP